MCTHQVFIIYTLSLSKIAVPVHGVVFVAVSCVERIGTTFICTFFEKPFAYCVFVLRFDLLDDHSIYSVREDCVSFSISEIWC